MPALLAMALALVIAGCGGDDDERRRRVAPPRARSPEGKKGGALTFLAAADVDYLDPGQTYYTFGYQINYAVNRTLYGFKPDDSVERDPGPRRRATPEISEDNLTVTVKIKQGIKYAPPVNREVKTADIKYAFERAFTSAVPSGYATSYFAEIEGAPDRARTSTRRSPASRRRTTTRSCSS